MEELTGAGTVVVGDTVNPDVLTPLGGIVRSFEARKTPSSHGDGMMHYDTAYPVWLGFWVTNQLGIPAAKYDAQSMVDQLWQVVYDDTLADIPSDNGESVVSVVSGNLEIYIRDGGGAIGGIAVAVVSITVTTEV
jgi:hypothetical protein